ncbi:MAG: response regulator [Pseudomonadota bacterium]
MILLVDDDHAMTDICAMLLMAHGYDVVVANSASDALSIISSHRVELLISDCAMPRKSGLELIHELRAGEKTRAIPILLMSGTEEGNVTGSRNYDGFLTKPFPAQELLAHVRRLLPPGPPDPGAKPED